MLNTIKQLKQQNEAAFNFALAGIITFCLAIIGLAYLFNDVMEQKQIAKQVGNLQMIESRIQTIISSNKLGYGETVAFLEFENNVNIFNKQWFEFKGKYHYSTKTIKEVDEVWQRINSNAKKIISMKKEMMAFKTVVKEVFVELKTMRKINDELVNILLSNNTDGHQLVMAKQMNVLLFRKEREIKDEYDGVEKYPFGDFEPNIVKEVADILNGFLSGNQDYGIKKIENTKARTVIESQMVVYKKMDVHSKTIWKKTPILFQFREAHAAIYRDSPQLKSALSKLNNHQLNKGLIVFVICIWLAFFACMFGFLRALTSSEAKSTEVKTV